MSKSVKEFGRVYTPQYLVNLILDFGGYDSFATQRKHVIDNSCGDGAFLREIVERYAQNFMTRSKDLSLLQSELETFVHGIEIDPLEHAKCLFNLDQTAEKYGLSNVHWDVINADAMETVCYDGKMDFVFGNPPYVRVHNLFQRYDSVKRYAFAEKGMTDLFIVFFEIGFNMLSAQGRMCLITPSSWLNSKAGGRLRTCIMQKGNLSGLIDLEHYQAFDSMTYSLISRFQNQDIPCSIEYFTFEPAVKTSRFRELFSLQDIFINGDFYLGSRNELSELRIIKNESATQYAQVRNGFATLADRIFVGDFDFSDGTIEILKASTGRWSRCIYPYDKEGKPLSEQNFAKNVQAYKYISQYRDLLSSKQKDNNSKWYLFGRTQALKDVKRKKYAINTIIKDIKSIKLTEVSEGQGVYSGLYILSNMGFDTIKRILLSEDFVCYVIALKKYRSGGYYTFSSKDLEQFLNHKLSASDE